MWHLQNLPTSLFFHFSSLHTVQTALFLLMCCHTSVNKHAELWVCYHRSKPLELDPVAQNNFSCNAVQLVKQIIFIIFKNLSQMRGVCLCVYTCTHPSVPEQCERERIPQRVTHNQPHTMARKTPAARPWITPRTNLRLCDGGMRGSVTPENRWQVWKMKAEAGRFGHTTPMTLEEVKRDGAGMRDRLWPHSDGFPGLQLRVPGASPKGICSGLLMRTPQGSQSLRPGLPSSGSEWLSVQMPSLLEAWPKPMTTSQCQLSLRKGLSSHRCGVPELEVMPACWSLRGRNRVRRSGKLRGPSSRWAGLLSQCHSPVSSSTQPLLCGVKERNIAGIWEKDF